MPVVYLDLHHFTLRYNFFPGGGPPDPPLSLGRFAPSGSASLRSAGKILHFHQNLLEALVQ